LSSDDVQSIEDARALDLYYASVSNETTDMVERIKATNAKFEDSENIPSFLGTSDSGASWPTSTLEED
jgi:hypothetical protein